MSTSFRGRPADWAPRLCEGVDPMGRGRAKAKQTKVARRLKYQTLDTDFEALQRELGQGESTANNDHVDDVEADDDDPYAEYADYDSDEDEDADQPARRR
jgi:Protein of unknown function (DUF3073)